MHIILLSVTHTELVDHRRSSVLITSLVISWISGMICISPILVFGYAPTKDDISMQIWLVEAFPI